MDIKELYTPPRCEELEMNLEGIIALSGDGSLSGYNWNDYQEE